MVNDAVLKASVQAYMALNKLKGKAAGPVLKLVKKLDKVIKDNPKTANAVMLIGSALVGAATITARIHLELDNTMDPEGLQSTMKSMMAAAEQSLSALESSAAEALQGLDPASVDDGSNLKPINVGWSVDQWGNEMGSTEYAERYMQAYEDVNDTVSKAIQSPELEKAMTGHENTMDKWSDMFAQADTSRAGGGDAVGELRNAVSYDEFRTMLKNGETPDYRALQDLAAQIETGEFDGEGRKALKDLIKQMPAGPEKKQLRGFIRARDAGKVLKTILNVTPHGAVAELIDQIGGKEAGENAANMAKKFGRMTKLGKSIGE